MEAEPAAWAAQKAFRDTGRKPDDQHFEISSRLYKTAPAVAANQAQGQDALDVYLGASSKPLEQLVDVKKVPLQHLLGRPHAARTDNAEAHALNLHYAKFGIDPDKAYDGDPLPMPMQARLQQAIKTADGSEIPLGIPGIYRGYDDGYFYAANDGTKESEMAQQLRRDLAMKKAEQLGDAALLASNDNDPETNEAVARSYQPKTTSEEVEKLTGKPVASTEETASAPSRLLVLISAIEKKRSGQPLSKDEEVLLKAVDTAFSDAGVPIDVSKVDIPRLKEVAFF